MKELMLMRHAKSDWHSHSSDIDRPLNKRGRADASAMGAYLAHQNIQPDCIVVSSAKRTQETIERLTADWQLPEDTITIDDELYLASHETLLALALAYGESCDRLMLVAHNPGMDYAVSYLAASPPPLSPSHKLMVTAAIAHFRCPSNLSQGLGKASCELIRLLRPREINSAA